MGERLMTLRRKLFWISVLYFAEGLPLGVVYDVLPVYFRQHNVSLKEIGFMFFLTLPWAIKVLWAPVVDRFGERRLWVAFSCSAMAAVMLAVPLFDASNPSTLLWSLLLAFTVLSATQDIAIDAYAIGLVEKGQEGAVNGVRVALYRVALMAGGGGTMWLVKPFGWTWIFIVLALAFIALAFTAWITPPVRVVHEPPREWARHLWRFLSRPGSIAVFAFILTYRMSDLLVGPMVKPFWVDRGMTPEEIGAISTIAGVAMSVLGALIGGFIASRIGLFHALWVFAILQAVPCLAYAGVAQFDLGWPFLYGASISESFTSGLGTAAFLSFLMRICDKDQAATQYAVLTTLFGLTRFMGGWSGFAAERFGYPVFFVLTFLLGIPTLFFLPWVRSWIGNGDGQDRGLVANTGGEAGGSRHTPVSAPAH